MFHLHHCLKSNNCPEFSQSFTDRGQSSASVSKVTCSSLLVPTKTSTATRPCLDTITITTPTIHLFKWVISTVITYPTTIVHNIAKEIDRMTVSALSLVQKYHRPIIILYHHRR